MPCFGREIEKEPTTDFAGPKKQNREMDCPYCAKQTAKTVDIALIAIL
jgi:hypothetical protein